jgi:hypothetical protein
MNKIEWGKYKSYLEYILIEEEIIELLTTDRTLSGYEMKNFLDLESNLMEEIYLRCCSGQLVPHDLLVKVILRKNEKEANMTSAKSIAQKMRDLTNETIEKRKTEKLDKYYNDCLILIEKVAKDGKNGCEIDARIDGVAYTMYLRNKFVSDGFKVENVAASYSIILVNW